MTRLLIGILGTRGIPNHYGGFEQFAETLAVGLTLRGHEVYVYCSAHHPYQEPLWNGVHLVHCKDPEDKFGTAGQFLYDRHCLLDARKRNFDILLHLGYTSDSVWHRLWPKSAVNIVNMDGLEWKRSKYNRLTRRFLRHAESMAAKHADVLVADSTVIRQHLVHRYNKEAHFIAYSASVFSNPDPAVLQAFNVHPFRYYLAVARMESENNLKMIIEGFLKNDATIPLLITGNTNNKYGRWLMRRYHSSRILFTGPLYDKMVLNNLRHHSLRYFHGHSAGGTNPSLLEAMACGCNIAAHDNPFNRAVLDNNADYFASPDEAAIILKDHLPEDVLLSRKKNNLEKIITVYAPDVIIDAYEALMLKSYSAKQESMA